MFGCAIGSKLPFTVTHELSDPFADDLKQRFQIAGQRRVTVMDNVKPVFLRKRSDRKKVIPLFLILALMNEAVQMERR